jgi:hypothetical protein
LSEPAKPAMRWQNSSYTGSSTMAREQALHFWRSALVVMIVGVLPPHLGQGRRAYGPSCIRRAISRPTSAEPVKAMPSTAGPTSASPTERPP